MNNNANKNKEIDLLELAKQEKSYGNIKKSIEYILEKSYKTGQTLNWFLKMITNNNLKVLNYEQKASLESLYNIYNRYKHNYRRYQESIDYNELYFQYETIIDAHSQPSHTRLNGIILRSDDPFWRKYFPPNDWDCRCSIRPYSQRDIDRKNLTVINSSDINFLNDIAPPEWSFDISKRSQSDVINMILNHYDPNIILTPDTYMLI